MWASTLQSSLHITKSCSVWLHCRVSPSYIYQRRELLGYFRLVSISHQIVMKTQATKRGSEAHFVWWLIIISIFMISTGMAEAHFYSSDIHEQTGDDVETHQLGWLLGLWPPSTHNKTRPFFHSVHLFSTVMLSHCLSLIFRHLRRHKQPHTQYKKKNKKKSAHPYLTLMSLLFFVMLLYSRLHKYSCSYFNHSHINIITVLQGTSAVFKKN